MSTPNERLSKLVKKEIDHIKTALDTVDNPLLACIDFIRQVDVVFISGLEGNNLTEIDKKLLQERYKYGWFLPLSHLMKRISDNTPFFPHPTVSHNKYLADSIIQVAGKLELCNRFCELETASLVTITEPATNSFLYYFNHQHTDIERYERESYEFVREILFKIVEPKYKEHIKKKGGIKKKIRNIVQNPFGQFISYQTTPEIDRYYSRLGYFHLVKQHGYEEFAEDDLFGGIPYKLYLDVVEDLMGITLKHIDCCVSLLSKNRKIDPYNIFTYSWDKSDTIKNFANHFSISEMQMVQIISCLTMSTGNVNFYNKVSGLITPPYFDLGNNVLTRSIYGCLNGAIPFLKMELKRKFEKDYFQAVNKREARFRKDLYSFFPGDRLKKLNKEVLIKTSDFQTDIDAVIFDPNTKALGLFQLKWQDTFAASLKERYSRMSNVIPKSVEWIDKILKWINSVTKTEVLKKLGLDSEAETINDIYLFVISRNHIHFTGTKLDERAAWCSWYQLVHSFKRIRTSFDDPIRELYFKLQFDSPQNRIEREGYPEIFPLKIELQSFSLSYKSN